MGNQATPGPESWPGPGFKPIETDAVDDVLSLEEEYVLGESLLEPRRIRLPRFLVWDLLVLLVLAAIAAVGWGLAHSTWTYGVSSVDSATTARLVRVREKLAAAGAPEAALRHLAIAAQPGINAGDAIEALVSADKALEPVSGEAAIAPVRRELRAILDELAGKRYGQSVRPMQPAVSATPIPLSITLTP